MSNKIKGGDLHLFIGGKSLAFAKSHTLTLSSDTSDTSNKDEGGGDWASNEIKMNSWSAKSENIMADTGAGMTYNSLVDAWIAKTLLTGVFGKKKETTTDVPTEGWTAGTDNLTGSCYITNIEVNATDGEDATYTVDFKGTGALVHNTTT
jgi:hypothetical protein